MNTIGRQTKDRREFLTRVAAGALAMTAAARNAAASEKQREEQGTEKKKPVGLPDVASAAGPVQPVDVLEQIPFAVYVTGAPILWNQELFGDGVLVGVVDSGVDDRHLALGFNFRHPALGGKVVARHDYVGDGLPVDAWHWHGTFVGGLIAANERISGMAPHARLADYRVIGADGTGYAADVAAAIDQAVADGCHVIYLGVASGTDHARLRRAIGRARKHALVVCGAGDNGDASLYPGRYPQVVTCGGVNYDPFPPPGVDPITHLSTSNEHEEVDIAADGGTLIGCDISPLLGPLQYRVVMASGSSLSAAIIAGGAALMLQRMWARTGRPVSVGQLRAAMLSSTVDILAPGRDTKSGAGVFSFLPELPAPDPVTSLFRLPNLDPVPQSPQPPP